MFSGIRRILGNIRVIETDTDITIDGIPADVMTKDISRIWRTSRININMFSKVGNSSLTFPRFFAVDVLYMIDHMIEYGNIRVSSRTLSKIRDLLIENTWLVGTQQEPKPRLNYSRLSNMVFKPIDYQQGFFEQYDKLTQQYSLNGYLLAAAAGSGKTFKALALAEMLETKRTIVICPKNAIYRVWEKSLKTLYKKPPSFWIYADGKPYKNERVLVFHYESLKAAISMIHKYKSTNMLVILDESHNLNEETSLRTQHFVELCKRTEAKDILPMSGTPIKALGGESIPLMMMIDPLFTEDAKMRYKKIYGRDGLRGIDILKHRMGIVSYKVEKHQLGLKEPDMKQLNVKVPNGNQFTLKEIKKEMADYIEARFKYYRSRRSEDESFYNECLSIVEGRLKTQSKKDQHATYLRYVKLIKRVNGDSRQAGEEIKWCNRYEKEVIMPMLPKNMIDRFKDVKSIIKYVHLKIQGEALGRVLGRRRIDCHVAMVPHIDFKGIAESTPKKTLVFTSFVEALEAADKHIAGLGLTPMTVYGKTNNELANTIKLFEKNEDVNPLCATYQSLSTAVPLVMADTMIMIDSPFRAYIHEQAISRIHRLGSDTKTTVWECKLDTGDEPNLSTRSSDILKWSQNQVAAIMGFEAPFEFKESAGRLTVSNEEFDVEDVHEFKDEIATTLGLEEGNYQKIIDW